MNTIIKNLGRETLPLQLGLVQCLHPEIMTYY